MSVVGAAAALTVFSAWMLVHVIGVASATAAGSGAVGLLLLWILALAMLWWVPVSWFERPRTVDRAQQTALDHLLVLVQIPVYNEDEPALRACLESVLAQSRLPDRIAVVDDGSSGNGYPATKAWFLAEAAANDIDASWTRTRNRGKRHAQMEAFDRDTDAEIFVTLDSDSLLDTEALAEGLKPFSDPEVMSVAGSVLALNGRSNALTALIEILYVPFTRGFRAAQSVANTVMVNSGTLAFYRADVVRRHARSYPMERFAGRPMQMNDDSMLTFYALLEGKTVHQPSSFAFTLVPETWAHYRNQSLRWMRGTFIRTLWWIRYLPPTRMAFWMPVLELSQLVLALVFGGVVVATAVSSAETWRVILTVLGVTLVLNYTIALRYFSVVRDDRPVWFSLFVFALAPVAAVWRFVVLRPLQLYAIATCRSVSSWGTRDSVEVGL